MRKKKVWRYYCDHCKKSGCSGHHMVRHEKGCFRNPNRECGFCREAGLTQKPMAELVQAVWDGGGSDLTAIRELSENCPACILAAIMQSGIQDEYEDCEDGGRRKVWVEFDYRKEHDEFWSSVNEDRNSRDIY